MSETEVTIPDPQLEESKSGIDNGKQNGTNESGLSSEELCKKIVQQVEYYFGNYNLPRDKFLNEQMQIDEGWIPLEVMAKFKRLAELSTNSKVILDALKSSDLIEVDAINEKIRRSLTYPVPSYNDDIKAETVKRTVYCKGFPRDGSVKLDSLLEFYKPFGPFETVHMRYFYDKATKKSGFKGSVLVVFPTLEKAEEFMKIDDIQYRKMPLLRKWYADYLEAKKLEYEERKARKEARLKQLEENKSEADAIEPLPKGTFLFLDGLPSSTTRDGIKGAILEVIDDVAYVDFAKGSSSCFIRLSTPDSNKRALEALQGKLKVNEADISVRLVEGEEEDEQIQKAQLAKARVFSQGTKRKSKSRRGGRFKRGKYTHT